MPALEGSLNPPATTARAESSEVPWKSGTTKLSLPACARSACARAHAASEAGLCLEGETQPLFSS